MFCYFCVEIAVMFQALTVYHSIFRWLVLISLAYALYRSIRGYRQRKPYSRTDNRVRHWTATIAHIQLVLGMSLYTQSPVVRYFWKNRSAAIDNPDTLFFGLIHILLMLLAVVLITVGASLAKRKQPDPEKYRTQLLWFAMALLIIICAIPWPFSPLASRPYIR